MKQKTAPQLATRGALAQAITRVESTRADHRAEADKLLHDVLPYTGGSIRLGITGVPGVGKSTFIEALGMHVIERGYKVAVLAVDPSSSVSGGSIMGDKTRMARLAQQENAYIRPSPSGGHLGGVARRTRESMLLLEAAGFDVIIVETVGVGQSETEVAEMVDMFTLLLLPGSGDELQGIKKGIVELADLLVVTKADGDLATQAERVRADYKAALRILASPTKGWQPIVLTASALENRGVEDVWQAVESFHKTTAENGSLAKRRAEQAKRWMWAEIRHRLMDKFLSDAGTQEKLRELEVSVRDGKIMPTLAAEQAVGFQ